jgi:two-component system, OmpR family, alkaline phosphatase synthesis response regulator PhoP
MTILVVEDQLDIANLVRINLEMLGLSVLMCHTLAQAERNVAEINCCMLVLDLGLPDGDGLHFCRELRKENKTFPILMLTARTSELERVEGLEIGADDYLTKPFSVMELQARVKALLRRSTVNLANAIVELSETSNASGSKLRFDGLTIDIMRREVQRITDHGTRIIDLTSTEFDLLVYLARHPGQVFNRQQLLSEVWGYHHVGYEHTVNSHINRLRSKIEIDPAQPRYVRTVWSVGYKFTAEGG